MRGSQLRDPKTQGEAVAIMAAKVGVKPADYALHLPGTYFLPLSEAKTRFKRGDGLESLYGSSQVANRFNVAEKIYAVPQEVERYIDPDIILGM